MSNRAAARGRRRLRRRVARILLATVATIQSVTPGIASIADGKPEALSYAATLATHVESYGARHHGAVHANECILARLALRLSAERPAAPALLDAIRIRPPLDLEVAPSGGHIARGGHHSRAPPAA